MVDLDIGHERCGFKIGDIVNGSWEDAISNGWDKPVAEKGGDHVTKGFICASVSYYLANKSPRTVRYYADVAAFFNVKIRDTFDMLSFSHFAHARKYDNWLEYLMFACSGGPDAGIVSVEGCEAEWHKRLKKNLEEENQADENPESDSENSEEENQADENKFSFPSVCRYGVNLVDRFRDDPNIPLGPRKKLSKGIKLIQEAVEEYEKFMVK
jgi:hypothetical protein